MVAKAQKPEVARAKPKGAGDSNTLPCDCEESWFRSSDDVRAGYTAASRVSMSGRSRTT